MIQAQLTLAPEVENRQSRRRVINYGAALRLFEGACARVTLTDLSTDGCRISASEPLPTGAAIMLKFPGSPAVRASIVWSDGNEAGCQFFVPLYPSLVEEAAQGVRPQGRIFGR